MEWMAAITGDCRGLFLDFSPMRKNLGNHLPRQKWMLKVVCFGNKVNEVYSIKSS
jgi:hypothetical protein